MRAATSIHDGRWPFESISHTRAAVAVSQYMANFFVDQCRSSAHRFASAAEEWAGLVYKHTTTTDMAPEFAQVYTTRGEADRVAEGVEALAQ